MEADAAPAWRTAGHPLIGREIVRLIEGGPASSEGRVTGWLAAAESDFLDAHGRPAALFHVAYGNGELAGDEEDLEAYEVEASLKAVFDEQQVARAVQAARAARKPAAKASKPAAAPEPARGAGGARAARTRAGGARAERPRRAPRPAAKEAAPSAVTDKAELERRMARDGWTMKRKVTPLGPITGTPRYYKPGDDHLRGAAGRRARLLPDLVVGGVPAGWRPSPSRRRAGRGARRSRALGARGAPARARRPSRSNRPRRRPRSANDQRGTPPRP